MMSDVCISLSSKFKSSSFLILYITGSANPLLNLYILKYAYKRIGKSYIKKECKLWSDGFVCIGQRISVRLARSVRDAITLQSYPMEMGHVGQAVMQRSGWVAGESYEIRGVQTAYIFLGWRVRSREGRYPRRSYHNDVSSFFAECGA